MAGAVPPGPLKPLGTILAPSVVISVHCAELRPFLGQTLTKLTVDVSIDDSEPKENNFASLLWKDGLKSDRPDI